MRPWIKRTLFGLLGAGIAFGGLTACGHRYDGHGWQMSAEDSAKMRGRMIERVSSKLDLNADQKQRLGVLADKLQEQRAALAGQGDPRAQVQALVAGDKFDRSRAQALVTEKTAALNSKSPEVIAALADFYDSLNPAQQQKVREFMQRRHGWRRG
ncbi:Spy/CpxP family protein refolding chaperone [Variovorax terrae]|uniref:Spy/CpxP family protein refolding chaperone n=1 Tax=Variovorax terrae TaxID=2923278 RepID=A0A9X1VU68_9BURK|nr:Spy/CpxP family protein refolding chaperone [Variovorax terrae]MCJ0763876.1 Spy/CpxP family protein refolding chaperone [Variovorax terrae]